MYDKVKELSQKTFPDGHTMTIVRPTFFDCRLLFDTRSFVFGMNNVVAEYQISSSIWIPISSFKINEPPLRSFESLKRI